MKKFSPYVENGKPLRVLYARVIVYDTVSRICLVSDVEQSQNTRKQTTKGRVQTWCSGSS